MQIQELGPEIQRFWKYAGQELGSVVQRLQMNAGAGDRVCMVPRLFMHAGGSVLLDVSIGPAVPEQAQQKERLEQSIVTRGRARCLSQ